MQVFANVCFFMAMLNAAIKKCATSFISYFDSFNFVYIFIQNKK